MTKLTSTEDTGNATYDTHLQARRAKDITHRLTQITHIKTGVYPAVGNKTHHLN